MNGCIRRAHEQFVMLYAGIGARPVRSGAIPPLLEATVSIVAVVEAWVSSQIVCLVHVRGLWSSLRHANGWRSRRRGIAAATISHDIPSAECATWSTDVKLFPVKDVFEQKMVDSFFSCSIATTETS